MVDDARRPDEEVQSENPVLVSRSRTLSSTNAERLVLHSLLETLPFLALSMGEPFNVLPLGELVTPALLRPSASPTLDGPQPVRPAASW